MIKNNKLKTGLLALLLCASTSVFADDSFEWHGYMRAGLGMDKDLSNMDKNENEVRSLGKYGLEYDDSAASVFKKTWTNSKGQWAEYNLGLLIHDYSDSNYDANTVYSSDNYVRLGNLDFLPANSSIWAGKRKETSTMSLLDYDFRNFNGHGFGYSSQTWDLNFYKELDTVDTGEYADVVAIDAIYKIAPLVVEATYTKATEDSTSAADNTKDGDSSFSALVQYTQETIFGFFPGKTVYLAQFGKGVTASELNFSTISDPDDSASRLALSTEYLGSIWTIEADALIESTKDDSASTTYTELSAASRFTKAVTSNLSMIYELSASNKTNVNLNGDLGSENDGLVYKVAAGPAIQLEASPWVRPVIRLSAAIIGGDKVITGFEDENEIRLGAQFETWF